LIVSKILKAFKSLKTKPIDLVLGLLVASSIIVFYNLGLLESLEKRGLDHLFSLRGQRDISPDVNLILLDDKSINSLGWPMSRDKYATLIDLLAKGEYSPKALGFLIYFFDQTPFDKALAEFTARSGNVYFSSQFILDQGRAGEDPNKIVVSGRPTRFHNIKDAKAQEAKRVILPVPPLLSSSQGVGHNNITVDQDGKVRWVPLLIRYGELVYPSITLQLATEYLGLKPKDIHLTHDNTLRLGSNVIHLNKSGEMLINYSGGWEIWKEKAYSFDDILRSYAKLIWGGESEKKAADRFLKQFKGKILLVGSSATGVAQLRPTPFDTSFPLIGIHGQVVSNLLCGNPLLEVSRFLTFGLVFFLCLGISVITSRQKPAFSGGLSVIVSATYYLGTIVLFHKEIWLRFVGPEIAIFATFITITLYHYIRMEFDFRRMYRTIDIRINRLTTLGELAAEKIHELKNPLNSMRINAQSLMRKLKAGTPDHERTQMLVEEIDRLNSIITDYMQFARHSPVKMTPLSINEVVKKSTEVIKPELLRAKVRLKLDLASSLPPVFGDNIQLQQVFLNLILNGIQAMPQGGDMTITTRIDPSQNMVSIEIEDTGEGIPPDVQDRVFYPFFTTKKTGTGLGLPVAKKIIESHLGKLSFASVPEKYTRFAILLPIHTDQNAK
jgi:signal transduction histidine kinase